MNKNEMTLLIDKLATEMTLRIEQIGEVISDPELPIKYKAKFQLLLETGTGFSLTLLELNKAIADKSIKTVLELQGAIDMLSSIEEWLKVTSAIFSE